MKKILLLSIALCMWFYKTNAQGNSIGAGISLNFNGAIGTNVNLGDVYNTLDFPFTFESWVNPNAYPPGYGGFIGSDNDVSAYHGFWIRLRAAGTVEVEFGNGLGSGQQYRRGWVTTLPIATEKWTHIAVVCNSVTDVHIYFNGVDKSIIATDGGSTSTLLNHSSASATLGGQLNLFAASNFNGQMDEIRLWNIARSQTDIQTNMCKKIDPGTSGLIGYWRADESYTSTTLNDYTTPAENGNVNGVVTKLTSGAPIGDESTYQYQSSWGGVHFSLIDANTGDKFIVQKVAGNPFGVHIYEVNSLPYSTSGLSTTPGYYFGVFSAEGATAASYRVIYRYTTTNGVTTGENKSHAGISSRSDGSVSSWANLSGTIKDTLSSTIRKNLENSRGEYILNLTGIEKILSDDASISGVNIYPNPAVNNFTVDFQSKQAENSTISLYDICGHLILQKSLSEPETAVNRGTLSSGIYFYQITDDGILVSKGKVIFE